jgi:hypothetical protein
VKILQAAAQQGLIDRVKWGSSTPLNDTSVPDAIGSQWDGKIFINAELALLDTNGPDMQLYIRGRSLVSIGIPCSREMRLNAAACLSGVKPRATYSAGESARTTIRTCHSMASP